MTGHKVSKIIYASVAVWSDQSSRKIVYILKSKVKNKTGKTLSKAEISGKLKLIFKDKNIEEFDLKSRWKYLRQNKVNGEF